MGVAALGLSQHIAKREFSASGIVVHSRYARGVSILTREVDRDAFVALFLRVGASRCTQPGL